ncbi:Myosin heavy chain, partial [Globisporangium splendens]
MRQQLFLPSAVIAAVAIVSAFGFAFGFASANSESANAFAPNAVLEGNKYPIVLVHGFAGWGRDELLGIKYWGGFQGDLQEQLKSQGHTVFTASVGPYSSNWDRACELYAQIKGTTVDFGATHSKHFDHARLGHTYSQGLYPQWGDVDPTTGGINKIHLIGHSMGGTTIRMLAQMLAHGSAGAPWGQEANASRESLFAGGKDWVHSITTISSPHLGSTVVDEISKLGGSTLKHVFFGIFAAFGVVGNSTEHFYDVKMDQWGIDAKGEHESLYQYIDRVLSSDLFTKPGYQDTGIWSCSTQGAAEENTWVRTLPNIYYMSYATSDTFATRDFLRRPTQLPHLLTMMLPLQPMASFMGSQYPIRHGFSTEWQENDGVVPTISMAKDATGDSVVVANETTGFSKIVRGKWNIMPKLDRLDHAAVIGFTLHKQINGIYLRHAKLLRSLPKEDAVVAVAIPGGAQVCVPPLAQPLVQPLTARVGVNEKLQQCGDPYLLMASTAASYQHMVEMEMTAAVQKKKARKQQRNSLFSAAPMCARHLPRHNPATTNKTRAPSLSPTDKRYHDGAHGGGPRDAEHARAVPGRPADGRTASCDADNEAARPPADAYDGAEGDEEEYEARRRRIGAGAIPYGDSVDTAREATCAEQTTAMTVAPAIRVASSDDNESDYQQEADEAEDDVLMVTWRTTISRHSNGVRDSFAASEYYDDADDGDFDDESFSLLPTRVAAGRSSSGASHANLITSRHSSSNNSFVVEMDESDCEDGSMVAFPTMQRRSSNGINNGQDDMLSRLATLKVLCDEGFISSDEYERRKCAIVDELTFSSDSMATQVGVAATQPSRMAFNRCEGLPLIVPHAPDFREIRPEIATKHVFDYAARQWSSTQVYVALDETPFSKGSLRVVYHLLDLSDGDGITNANHYVAKLAIDPEEDPQTYFRDTELQAHCAHYAQMYNSYNPPKRVEFINSWVLELTERNGALCAVEPYIPGEYRKHNNNFGSVSDDERNTPQSFSHFTYEASNHKLLAVDIQGVGDLYTDPQIHTRNGNDFGKGNLGVLGFQKFLSSHRCNSICRYLKLPSVNPKDRHADSGTLPVQELMNRDRVRPMQFDSKHYYESAPMLQKYITQCRELEEKRSKTAKSTNKSSNGHADKSFLVRILSRLFCGCGGQQ